MIYSENRNGYLIEIFNNNGQYQSFVYRDGWKLIHNCECHVDDDSILTGSKFNGLLEIAREAADKDAKRR